MTETSEERRERIMREARETIARLDRANAEAAYERAHRDPTVPDALSAWQAGMPQRETEAPVTRAELRRAQRTVAEAVGRVVATLRKERHENINKAIEALVDETAETIAEQVTEAKAEAVSEARQRIAALGARLAALEARIAAIEGPEAEAEPPHLKLIGGGSDAA